jgi:hypothetical protein
MPYARNQKRVLGISDLIAYSMATGSDKEQSLGETQFDSGFLKQLKELITRVIQEERSMGPSPRRTPPATRHHNQNPSLPRTKLDFLDGMKTIHPVGCQERSNFFRFHGTPEASRVDIASIHLEGEAIQWYDWFEASHGITWATFVEGLLVRFGPSAFEDVDDELAKIRQTSSVSEYQSRFERLANRAHDWSERQLICTFVEGLRSDIMREVKTYRPWTILAAFSFARVQEKKLSEETRRSTRAFSRPTTGGNGSSSTPS